jgi:hypothetical protein
MSAAKNKFVRIAYNAPAGKITAKERAARKHLETAINTAMEEFHEEAIHVISEMEVYPCDCAAEAA